MHFLFFWVRDIVKQVGVQEDLDKMNVDNFPKSIKKISKVYKTGCNIKTIRRNQKSNGLCY